MNYRDIFKNSEIKVRKISNSITDSDYEKSPLNQKTIIAAGRLDYVKGYDLLIEAYTMVAKKHPDWKLKIFGSGSEKNNLLNQIQENNLYNQVLLMGPTKNLQKELENASIFVVSSRMEGFGLVIVEAMQKGVPVVSFNCPHGPSEIIKHEEDGILVENGNVNKLGEAINRLIENEKLRKKLGSKAYENVQRFSVEYIGEQWDKFFSDLLNSKV